MRTESVVLVRALAGERADRFASEYILHPVGEVLRTPAMTIRAVRDAFCNAELCLRILLGHYAFARRGKDRAGLSEAALCALETVSADPGFDAFLELPDATSLWDLFEQECIKRRLKTNESQNRGVVQGMAELAQEVHRLPGVESIAEWVVRSVSETDRMEPQFLRIVDIRGVGPKITSMILRDLSFLFALEERIERADRIYIQPIDKWIRALAPYIINEPNSDGMADWVLAGKITKYSRWAGVSAVRFNMGAGYFGFKEIRDPENTGKAVTALVTGSDPSV